MCNYHKFISILTFSRRSVLNPEISLFIPSKPSLSLDSFLTSPFFFKKNNKFVFCLNYSKRVHYCYYTIITGAIIFCVFYTENNTTGLDATIGI